MKKRFIVIIVLVVGALCFFLWKNNTQNCTNLLIVGDSIGEGAGASDPSLKWYKYLIPYVKENYGDKLEITNVSMGGNTSYAGYVRTMELDDGKDYDIVIVCYGQNDEEENFSFYYEQMLQAIRKRWPSCQLITILESSQRGYTPKIQDILLLSREYKAFVADTIAAFEDSGMPYEELCDDGTHPNDEGQKVYFHEVAQILDEIYMNVQAKEDVDMIKGGDGEVYSLLPSTFCYYSKDKFEKVDALTYKVAIEKNVNRIGIDFVCISGHQEVMIALDGQKIWEYPYDWNYGFEQRHILEADNKERYVNEVTVRFSSEEQMKKFYGIILE